MNLSEEAIQEFYALWQEDHPGRTLTRKELMDMAGNTLRAFELLLRPIPRAKAKGFKNLYLQDLVSARTVRVKDADLKKIC